MAKAKEVVSNKSKYKEYQSITIKKVSNGYYLSAYGDSGEWAKIAKTEEEVIKFLKTKLK